MDSRAPVVFNPGVITAILNQYLYIRQFLWNSFPGKCQALYRNDAKSKATICNNLNAIFYNTDEFELYDSYLYYRDSNDLPNNELINNFQKQIIHKHAFLFIATSTSLVRYMIENRNLIGNEQEIIIKNEQQKSLKIFITEFLENKPKSTWHTLLKEDISFMTSFTNHHHSKLLKHYLKIIITLGENSLENSFISNTQHAIRTYLIEKIKKSYLENEFNDYLKKKKFKLDHLKTDIEQIKNRISDIKAANDAVSLHKEQELLEKKLSAYYTSLRHLAHLGDAISIVKATEENLFNKLLFLENVNFHFSLSLTPSINNFIPMVYHPNFYCFQHEMNCHELEKINHCDPEFLRYLVSFKEFEKLPNFPTELIIPKVDCLFSQAAVVPTILRLSKWFYQPSAPTTIKIDPLGNPTTEKIPYYNKQ